MGCGASADERADRRADQEDEDQDEEAHRRRVEAAKESEASWMDDPIFKEDICCDRYEFAGKLKEIELDNKSKHGRLQGVNLKSMVAALDAELEDDNHPCHPTMLVSTKSLFRAFEREGLTEQNAMELVRLAAGPICKREQLARYLKDLKEGGACEKPKCFDGTCKLNFFLHLHSSTSTLTQDLPLYVTATAIARQWHQLEIAVHGPDVDGPEAFMDFEELCLLAHEHVTELIVIQLNVFYETPGSSTAQFTCTTLAGEEVLVIAVDVQRQFVADVRSAVASKLGVSAKRLQMATPDGDMLRPSDCRQLCSVPFFRCRQVNS